MCLAALLCLAVTFARCTSNQLLENTAATTASGQDLLGPTLTRKQALEDFEYLFATLRDRYPYFELKKRTEGYDWPTQESEFRKMVARAKTNEEFAKAISRIVFSFTAKNAPHKKRPTRGLRRGAHQGRARFCVRALHQR
jgi:hypothetical protein